MPTFARLPAAPLQRELARQRRVLAVTWAELAARLDISERTLARLLAARDLAEPVADRMACRLGLHPVLLWPRLWLRASSGRSRTAS
jgi:plasmid maintenance system antidote protein VapI